MLENIIPQAISIIKHEFNIGVFYPLIVSFILMLALIIFKIPKNLRWIGGMFGGLFAIISMLKFINFKNTNNYTLYISRHDKMIYLIILACILALLISFISLVIKKSLALRIISFFLVIAFTCASVFWYKILKIESSHFDYVNLAIVTGSGIVLFGLLVNDGFSRDVSGAIGLTAFCIVYGILFQKYNITNVSNTFFALSGVSLAYVLLNYIIFSFRFSVALSFMMGGMLLSIIDSQILFNNKLDIIKFLTPLILLFVSPVCRLFLNIVLKSTNRVYKYVLPILCLIFSIIIGGTITVSLTLLM